MLLFACILALAHSVLSQTDDLKVNTTQGVVQGSRAVDGNYNTFYGVHYGGNTAGENRFKGPTPPPKYPGDFSAHDSNILCAQPSPTGAGIIGTEDCLTLNIFTTGTSPAKPVLVWLQGEEYTNTYSKIETPGKSFRTLATAGLVVVQMNYRLSIFGFLCLGVPEAPGNAGLKDIVQGLQWVKENIAGFGGDPNNVVLFGHGSAAAMVDLITMSPLANGLAHKAIALSGSALAPWAVSYTPIKYAHAFGAKLAYTDKTDQELAKLLTTTDITLIGNALKEFEFHNNSILFAPCIENAKLIPNNTFLADAPLNILKLGNFSDIPYISGYTNREGTIRAEQAALNKPSWLDVMQTNFTGFLPVDLNFGNNLTTNENTIRDYYFGQKTISIDTIEDFLEYQGDTLVLVSVLRGIKERSLKAKSPVRLMEFAYKGTKNTEWIYTTVPQSGARHGILLNFLLDYDLTDNDKLVSTSLINRIKAFALTGNPDNNGSQWPVYTSTSTNYLLYSGDGGMSSTTHSESNGTSPHSQKMVMWDNLYSSYYVPPRPVSSSGRVFVAVVLLVVSQIVLSLFSI